MITYCSENYLQPSTLYNRLEQPENVDFEKSYPEYTTYIRGRNLKTRIKDHLFLIDQELELENDPSYR